MKRAIFLTGLTGLIHLAVRAQGCSDAGVCTAGAIGQLPLWQDSVADADAYRHSARVLYSYAVGEQGTSIMQVVPELNIGIGERCSLQAKLPYVMANGELGTNNGLGDAIITGSYTFISDGHRKLIGTTGLRLPTGTTNATTSPEKGSGNVTLDAPAYALPMPYQSGLGTLDLLFGLQYRTGGWIGALAYQHVLDQGNENMFSHAAWNNDPAVAGYFESDMLHRGNDLMARVQYTYGCGRLALQPGVLAIYRLQKDTRLISTVPMSEMGTQRVNISGSQGLTLNVTADLRYKVAERWAVEASFGTPVITREVRPDGLTRSLVTGVALRYRF